MNLCNLMSKRNHRNAFASLHALRYTCYCRLPRSKCFVYISSIAVYESCLVLSKFRASSSSSPCNEERLATVLANLTRDQCKVLLSAANARKSIRLVEQPTVTADTPHPSVLIASSRYHPLRKPTCRRGSLVNTMSVPKESLGTLADEHISHPHLAYWHRKLTNNDMDCSNSYKQEIKIMKKDKDIMRKEMLKIIGKKLKIIEKQIIAVISLGKILLQVFNTCQAVANKHAPPQERRGTARNRFPTAIADLLTLRSRDGPAGLRRACCPRCLAAPRAGAWAARPPDAHQPASRRRCTGLASLRRRDRLIDGAGSPARGIATPPTEAGPWGRG